MANFALTNSTGTGGIGGVGKAVTTTYITFTLVGNGSSANTSGSPSGGVISPYTLRRGKIYDILIGTPSTPGDTALQFDCSRMTAMGSSGSIYAGALSSVSSGISLDPADGLIAAYAVVNSCAETNYTFTNSLWNVGVNQRASYRWVAAPGSELVYPAVSSAGLGLRTISPSYTGVVTGTVLFQEQ